MNLFMELFGMFIGGLVISFGIAVIWLISSYTMPFLHKHQKKRYVIAMILSVLSNVIAMIGGGFNLEINLTSFLSIIACVTILKILMNKALNKGI